MGCGCFVYYTNTLQYTIVEWFIRKLIQKTSSAQAHNNKLPVRAGVFQLGKVRKTEQQRSRSRG